MFARWITGRGCWGSGRWWPPTDFKRRIRAVALVMSCQRSGTGEALARRGPASVAIMDMANLFLGLDGDLDPPKAGVQL